jgi:hypothetical protein
MAPVLRTAVDRIPLLSDSKGWSPRTEACIRRPARTGVSTRRSLGTVVHSHPRLVGSRWPLPHTAARIPRASLRTTHTLSVRGTGRRTERLRAHRKRHTAARILRFGFRKWSMEPVPHTGEHILQGSQHTEAGILLSASFRKCTAQADTVSRRPLQAQVDNKPPAHSPRSRSPEAPVRS